MTEHGELWDRIADFAFDRGDEELTFAERLARENAWTKTFAARVLEEYRRFMYLAVVHEAPVTPSDAVDQAWHLHLTYSRSYWQAWCEQVLRHPVHHEPTSGSERENARYRDQYESTLARYREAFDREPPGDIWPPADERFAGRFQRVDMQTAWGVKRRRRRSRLPPVLGQHRGRRRHCRLLGHRTAAARRCPRRRSRQRRVAVWGAFAQRHQPLAGRDDSTFGAAGCGGGGYGGEGDAGDVGGGGGGGGGGCGGGGCGD